MGTRKYLYEVVVAAAGMFATVRRLAEWHGEDRLLEWLREEKLLDS